jgi:V/A-type H+/Na+-transporting ATPase subunit I
MSLRPVAAHWFELVTSHAQLAQVMECLSRTGAVELEARSRVSDRLLFPGLDEALKAHRELARRYQHYWPAPVCGEQRTEPLHDLLAAARARVAEWTQGADPLIASIERATREAGDLAQLRLCLEVAASELPDLRSLGAAGPKVNARLIVLPAGATLHEVPSLALVKRWEVAGANCALVVGRPPDVAAIEAQVPALKAQVVQLPPWLPASRLDALAAIDARLAGIEEERKHLQAELEALSARLKIACALGDIALIEWLNEHAKDLRGSERLAWVTGWTTDIAGEQLRRALDATRLRYILRIADAPDGLSPPMMLRNPAWAKPFEIFARLLGTPSPDESDPTQLLPLIAAPMFGFMFADVGHGAVLLLAGILLGRRFPLTRILVPGGVMAMVFGALFGSVFCREDLVPAFWLRPLDEPVVLLVAAVVMGVVVIAIGLLLDAVQMHWRDQAAQWWEHRAGLLAAYAGLVVAPLAPRALLLAAIGAAWFVGGAAAEKEHRRVASIAGAAAEFVEEVVRLLVNTVSFARIGAFALAHAGLSVAVLELAKASGGWWYWPVLALGNVLILALEGMVVSIQTTRLLLFEFFVRFLTGGGREFKPLPPPSVATPAAQEPLP